MVGAAESFNQGIISSAGFPFPGAYSPSRLGAYSPLLNSSAAYTSINVLKPSSIQGYRLSSLPTIIGNQLCPISCAVTQYNSPALSFQPSNTMPGYSIPPAIPASLMATGYGYTNHFSEKYSIDFFKYSVALPQAFSPALSTGYTDMDNDFFPPGKLTLPASPTSALYAPN